MKDLVFGEGHLIPTLIGEKVVTIRRFDPARHTFEKGEMIRGLFPIEGVSLILQATEPTRRYPLKNIPEQDRIDDGFTSVNDTWKKMKAYYPDLTIETEMGVIRFGFPKIDGVPTVEIVDITQFEGMLRNGGEW
jgi:hypothetical protein